MQQRASGGQHGIHQEDWLTGKILWQCFQVRHWLVGFFIASQANEAHLRVRNHGERRVNHAQASADNRHDNRWLSQAETLSGGHGGLNIEGLQL